MSQGNSNAMPTDDDLILLRELLAQADSIDDVRKSIQQREAKILRGIVNSVFDDQPHLAPQPHPAEAHFDRIVNEMSDREARAINNAAVDTFGGPAFNPVPTPHVTNDMVNSLVRQDMNDEAIDDRIYQEERRKKIEEQEKKGKEGGKKKSKKTKKGKQARRSKKAKKIKK